LLLLLLSLSVILFAACSRKSSDMVGIYIGNYFGGTETFTLSADGGFTQRFVLGGKTLYENRGGWTLAGRKVCFTHFISALPYFERGRSAEDLKPLDSFIGTIPVGASVIVFYDDADYLVRKQ
jgi:hypothetical protein